jgi:hypothetical protein
MQTSNADDAPFCLQNCVKEIDLGVLEAISLSGSWMFVSF